MTLFQEPLDVAVGVTLVLDLDYEEIKPSAQKFEATIHKSVVSMLCTESSRIEFLGIGTCLVIERLHGERNSCLSANTPCIRFRFYVSVSRKTRNIFYQS